MKLLMPHRSLARELLFSLSGGRNMKTKTNLKAGLEFKMNNTLIGG